MDQKEFKVKMEKAKKKIKENRTHEVCKASLMQSRAFGENGSRQLYILSEEMSELNQCVMKALRGKTDKLHTIEELADVTIALEYLKLVLDISEDEVNKAVNVKLDRIERNTEIAKKTGKPSK